MLEQSVVNKLNGRARQLTVVRWCEASIEPSAEASHSQNQGYRYGVLLWGEPRGKGDFLWPVG